MTKILLVEDDIPVQELLALFLARDGFKVVATDLLEEGLELLEKHPDIALLITDGDVRDGFSAPLIAAASFSGVSVIAMSGRPENEAPMREAGASRFLSKPFATDELLRAVAELIGERV